MHRLHLFCYHVAGPACVSCHQAAELRVVEGTSGEIQQATRQGNAAAASGRGRMRRDSRASRHRGEPSQGEESRPLTDGPHRLLRWG
jgi:hypothetical protein